MNQPILKIGHSPDPDDAFMFCALARRAVRIRNYAIEHVMEDIESLNLRALKGELEVTAISAHAYVSLADRYWVLSTGASMGEGYGPVLVSKKSLSPQELTGKRVAIPGEENHRRSSYTDLSRRVHTCGPTLRRDLRDHRIWRGGGGCFDP